MNLNFSYETELQEFKRSMAELDKGIITIAAMLNKNGKGKVYFGVEDSGEIVGVDLGKETIKKISTRYAEAIRPKNTPKISLEPYEDKYVISLEAQGDRRPYAAFGEYRIRVGSENKKIEPEELGELFFTNSTLTAESIEALNQELSFEQLKSLYIMKGLSIDNNTFCQNMGLLTSKGRFNYIAELLADNNNFSIKVVKFKGKNKLEMLSRNEYGYKCMLVAMRQVYDYIVSLNEVRVDTDKDMERKEKSLFDIRCFDEAWTNACLHNRWVRNVPPAVYIYDDRIEIISIGGLPLDFTKEEFFAGVSRPINIVLQKIMGQLGFVEQTGHGVPTILAVYGKEAFDIAANHITVTIPFSFVPSMKQISFGSLSVAQAAVLRVIKDNPTYTIGQISNVVQLGTSRVSKVLSELKQLGKLERIGGKKGGFWKVL